jgi:hypothetical protein
VCEEPLRQWTVMNECYAVELEHSKDALGRAYGTSVPFACDLEWYAGAAPVDGEVPIPGPAGFSQVGEVEGVIELASGPLEVQAVSTRWRWWGELRFEPQPAPPAWHAPVRLGPDLVLDHRLTPTGWLPRAFAA